MSGPTLVRALSCLILLLGPLTAALAALAHPNAALAPEVRAEIVEAAAALVRTIPAEPGAVENLFQHSQRDLLLREFTDDARRDWSYWPRSRAGLSLGQMNAEQRRLTQEVLAAILSASGHLKVAQIMQLEEFLRALETTSFPRTIENYTILFFGMPSVDRAWGLRFEGHHVSINLTLGPSGHVSVTPFFLGASPSSVVSGPLAGLRVLRLEEDLARKLARSLEGHQRTQGTRSQAPSEVLSTQFERNRQEWPVWRSRLPAGGLGYSAMTNEQRARLRALVTAIVTAYRPEIAEIYLRRSRIRELSFLWMGSLEPGEPHYYIIQSPDFVFEYDNAQGNASHIHTVWRDPSNDFGDDMLAQHYEQAH